MILNKTIGAALILAGTCIGAGMLALPVSVAPLGFSLGLITMMALWAFMYLTGLLVLETNLWFKEEANYISMAKATLGNTAKWLTWLAFLLLLYALMTAYIMGGSAILVTASQVFLNLHLAHWLAVIIWAIFFAVIIFCGAGSVDIINKIFMFGLITAFALLAALIIPHMHFIIHSQSHPIIIFAALPIIITSFGYHIVVPSMSHYLHRKKTTLRRIIFWGSILPLLVYILWDYIVFGSIPIDGAHGLLGILHHGNPASELTSKLADISQSHVVGFSARAFAIFALASSFIGVALGLFDLLADGCSIPKNNRGKMLTAALTFLPPIIFTLFYPHGFITALAYAGLFVALIHGLLPALMVWSGRYRQHRTGPYQVFAGKATLIAVMIISIIIAISALITNIH